MADTSAYHNIERWVRDFELPKRFKQPFEKKRLPIGTKSNGTPATHEFDAVSGDGKIVVSVKASSGKTTGGKGPSGKIKDSYAEVFFLSRLQKRDKRFLVLTDREYYELFKKDSDGKIPEGVEMMNIEPPEHLAEEVHKARKKASEEVSPRRPQ